MYNRNNKRKVFNNEKLRRIRIFDKYKENNIKCGG